MIVTAACVVGMLVCLLVASRRDKQDLIRDVRRALDGETEESLVRRRCREPLRTPLDLDQIGGFVFIRPEESESFNLGERFYLCFAHEHTDVDHAIQFQLAEATARTQAGVDA